MIYDYNPESIQNHQIIFQAMLNKKLSINTLCYLLEKNSNDIKNWIYGETIPLDCHRKLTAWAFSTEDCETDPILNIVSDEENLIRWANHLHSIVRRVVGDALASDDKPIDSIAAALNSLPYDLEDTAVEAIKFLLPALFSMGISLPEEPSERLEDDLDSETYTEPFNQLLFNFVVNFGKASQHILSNYYSPVTEHNLAISQYFDHLQLVIALLSISDAILATAQDIEFDLRIIMIAKHNVLLDAIHTIDDMCNSMQEQRIQLFENYYRMLDPYPERYGIEMHLDDRFYSYLPYSERYSLIAASQLKSKIDLVFEQLKALQLFVYSAPILKE